MARTGSTFFRKGNNPLSVVPEYEQWYMEYFEKADYDDFWKDPMLAWDEHYAETSDIPMLQVGGWYDIFLAGTFKNFSELRKLKRAGFGDAELALATGRSEADVRRKREAENLNLSQTHEFLRN